MFLVPQSLNGRTPTLKLGVVPLASSVNHVRVDTRARTVGVRVGRVGSAVDIVQSPQARLQAGLGGREGDDGVGLNGRNLAVLLDSLEGGLVGDFGGEALQLPGAKVVLVEQRGLGADGGLCGGGAEHVLDELVEVAGQEVVHFLEGDDVLAFNNCRVAKEANHFSIRRSMARTGPREGNTHTHKTTSDQMSQKRFFGRVEVEAQPRRRVSRRRRVRLGVGREFRQRFGRQQ